MLLAFPSPYRRWIDLVVSGYCPADKGAQFEGNFAGLKQGRFDLRHLLSPVPCAKRVRMYPVLPLVCFCRDVGICLRGDFGLKALNKVGCVFSSKLLETGSV